MQFKSDRQRQAGVMHLKQSLTEPSSVDMAVGEWR